MQYESRLRSLDDQRDTMKAELDAAKRSRVLAEQQLAGYHKVEKDIRQIYDDEWSTQNERLTPFIGEVMRLATASRLVPRSYSFGGTQSKGVAKTQSANALEVSMGFPGEGTVKKIRTLI